MLQNIFVHSWKNGFWFLRPMRNESLYSFQWMILIKWFYRSIVYGLDWAVSRGLGAFYQVEMDLNASSVNVNGAPGSVEYGLKLKEIGDSLMQGIDRTAKETNDTSLPLRTIRAVKLTR